jgi:hypothetical protein
MTYGDQSHRRATGSPQAKTQGRIDSVGDLIGKVVRANGLDRTDPLDGLRKAWREAVGRQAASSTRLKSFRGGTLTVEVDSAVLAQELGVYHKRELLGRLRSEARVPLQDIRFRVVGGGI